MKLTGVLYDASGPLGSVQIEFTATRTTQNGVVVGTKKEFTTGEDGSYSIELKSGYYDVTWRGLYTSQPVSLGTVRASPDVECTLPEALRSTETPLESGTTDSFIQDALDVKASLEQTYNIPDNVPFGDYTDYIEDSIIVKPMVLEFNDGEKINITEFGYYPEYELTVGVFDWKMTDPPLPEISIAVYSPRLTALHEWGELNKLYTNVSGFVFGDPVLGKQSPMLTNVPGHLPEWVTIMTFMFSGASVFNDPAVIGWDTSRVTKDYSMAATFNNARRFNQDLSGWCVSAHISEPPGFSQNADGWEEHNKPVWGTCPQK